MKHHVERTSPKGPGMPFIGTCRLCGKPNLPASAALDDCDGHPLNSTEGHLAVLRGIQMGRQLSGVAQAAQVSRWLERARATQCCDAVINGLIGQAIEIIGALALSSTDRVTLPGHDETMANLDALTISTTESK